MAKDRTKPCGIAETLLVRCLDLELPEFEEIRVLRHVADCPDCAEQIQRMRVYRQSWAVLSPEFPTLVQRMTALVTAGDEVAVAATATAANDWVAVQQGLGVFAQQEAASGGPLFGRLNEWKSKLGQATTGALKELARFTRDSVEHVLVPLNSMREFGAVISGMLAEPVPVRAFRDVTLKNPEGDAPQVPSGVEAVTIQIRYEETTLVVSVAGLPETTKRLMIVVVPEGGSPVRSEAQRRGKDWRASFRNLNPGKCTIGLEPLSDSHGQ